MSNRYRFMGVDCPIYTSLNMCMYFIGCIENTETYKIGVIQNLTQSKNSFIEINIKKENISQNL